MGFINLAEKTVHAKLVYYGIGAGGKTTSLQAVHTIMCSSNEVNLVSIKTEQDATLLFDFLPINLGTVEGYQIVIQGFTVPGQPKYKRMRKYVLQGADAVVLVVDSQRSRLEENKEALDSLLDNLKGNGLDPEKIPIVIQYNKRDLDDILSEEEMNPHFLVRDDVQAFPSVATDHQGVYETFVHAAGLLVEQKIKQYDLGKGEVEPETVASGARNKLWSLFDVWREEQEQNNAKDEVLEFTVDENTEPVLSESLAEQSRVAEAEADARAEAKAETEAEANRLGSEVDRPSERGSPDESAAGTNSQPDAVREAKTESGRGRGARPQARPPVASRPGRRKALVDDWGSLNDAPGAEEPAAVEPVEVEPAAVEPAEEESVAVEPAAVEPAEVEPAAAESADAEGVAADQEGVAADQTEDPVTAAEAVPETQAPTPPVEATESTDSAVPRAAVEGAVEGDLESAVDSDLAELFSDDDLDFDLAQTLATEESESVATSSEDPEAGLLDMALQSNLQMAEAFGELDQYKAALRRKNEELVRFTQNTIHDLNKPLSAVKLMLTSVIKGYFGEVGGRVDSAIQNSMAAVHMMERLMGDLMDSIVLDTTFEMTFGEVDLGVLISDVLRTLRYNIEEADVGIRVEPMPVIVADEWALTKAFMNLIGNAIQYSSPERAPRIWISCETDGDEHVIRVSDNGIGVPEENRGDLFLRFERGTNTGGISGTGLGLHIVKEVVLGHGGTIELESEVDVGTTFTIRLPVAPIVVPQSEVSQTAHV